jgi:hypothetical protein
MRRRAREGTGRYQARCVCDSSLELQVKQQQICDACKSRHRKCMWLTDSQRVRKPRCFHCAHANSACCIEGELVSVTPTLDRAGPVESVSAFQPQARSTRAPQRAHASAPALQGARALAARADELSSNGLPNSDSDVDTEDGQDIERLLFAPRPAAEEAMSTPEPQRARRRIRPAPPAAVPTATNEEPESEPEIMEIPRPPPVKIEADGPVDRAEDEAKLREAVRALEVPTMDAVALGPITKYLKGYFSVRVGRRPNDLQCEIVRALLANTSTTLDEDLRRVLREFYAVIWARARCKWARTFVDTRELMNCRTSRAEPLL